MGGGGGGGMNVYKSNMSELKNKTNYVFDGTLKKVHTDVTDSSCYEESFSWCEDSQRFFIYKNLAEVLLM